eukprot:234232_1
MSDISMSAMFKFKCFHAIAVCLVSVISQSIVYIKQNGSDLAGCGKTLNGLACGTLFYASTIVSNHTEIIVIDGQNSNEISKYSNSSHNIYHPCLMKPFNKSIDITITFNTHFIRSMNDWFPFHLCLGNHSQSVYNNAFLFDGATSLTINNLIINGLT